MYVLLLFMSNVADMTERHRQALTELAELGLSLARKLHAQAETVEDVEQAAELSLAFHRVSRSVRQTVALEAKLERDALQFANENTPIGAKSAARGSAAKTFTRLDGRSLREHATKMRAAVERMVYECLDREDADWLMEDVDFQLASMDPAIMNVPVETYVANLKRELEIPEAANQSDASGKAKSKPSAHNSA